MKRRKGTMRNRYQLIALLAVAGSLAVGTRTFAQTNPAPKSVDERLNELEQEIRVLKRQKEADQEAADAKKKETPVVTAGADGFGFKSADGAFVLKLRGQIQTDARFYLDENANAVN